MGTRGTETGTGELLNSSKMYVYSTTSNALSISGFNITEPASGVSVGSPYGSYDDGTNLWLIDSEDKQILAYAVSDKVYVSGRTISLSALTAAPKGIGSKSATSNVLWVSSVGNVLHAFNKTTGAKLSDVTLDTANSSPTYLTSDGATLWVADAVTTSLIYAYAIDNDAEDNNSGFTLHTDNANPQNMWTDGTTIYVLDTTDTLVYAYNVDGGARDSAKDIDLDSANANPAGIWADGTTMWVGDTSDTKLYAYTISSRAYNSSEDIDLDSANANPVAIWVLRYC